MMTQMRLEIERSLSLFRGTAEETRCDIIFSEHSGFCDSEYLSQLSQPAAICFFKASVLFSIENAKIWPIFANFGYFVANLRTF